MAQRPRLGRTTIFHGNKLSTSVWEGKHGPGTKPPNDVECDFAFFFFFFLFLLFCVCTGPPSSKCSSSSSPPFSVSMWRSILRASISAATVDSIITATPIPHKTLQEEAATTTCKPQTRPSFQTTRKWSRPKQTSVSETALKSTMNPARL